MSEIKNKLNKIITIHNINRFARYANLLIALIFIFYFAFLKKCFITYSQDGSPNENTMMSAIVSLSCAAVIILLSLIRLKISDRVNKIISYVLFFLSPIYCYYAFEFFQRSIYSMKVLNIPIRYLLLNFILLALVLLTIVIITNSTKIAVIGLTLIINLFGVVNYYIYSFRGVAIVASDVLSIKTATSVASGYQLFVDYHICYMFIVTLFIITVVSKFKNFKALPSLKFRIPASVIYMFCLAICLNVFVFTNQLANWNIKAKLFNPHAGYKWYGTFVAFVRSIRPIIIEKPDGYSIQLIENIADQFDENDGDGKRPNIIVIMDESFSDLKMINDFATNEDYMPFIRSLQENTIHGTVYSSVFGGNTANSEFEFLTGNSMGLLPGSAIAYQLYIKDAFPSIVNNFEKLNYAGNLAMHPYYPTGFRRSTVYPLLGFKEFISLDSFAQSATLRGKVTDEANFNKIIEEYEKSKKISKDPFFLFNITMQNHGGYENNDPNFETKIKITDEYYYYDEAENYLSLVKYTDEAVEKLVNYFSAIDDPTVIIFFGDHQPGLKKSWYNKLLGEKQDNLNSEELMAKYQIPFFAWANYDIDEEVVDGISLNYLSAYIFDKLGINLTKYQQFLLNVYQQVPVMNSLGYWGADGKFYNYEDKKSPYYELINEYRCVQYNNMHDRGNRVNRMFYLN